MPSPEARTLVQWIARSNDHGRAPFLVVDKRSARVLVYDAAARLVADAPVLLGAGRGRSRQKSQQAARRLANA